MSKKHLLKAGIIGALCLTVTSVGIACSTDNGGNNDDKPTITNEMVVDIADVELEIGQRERVTVDVTNMEGEEIDCKCSNSAIAFYDKQNGQIVGLQPGNVTFTFTLKNKPSISKTIDITVIQTTEYTVVVGDSAPVTIMHGGKITKPADPSSWQDEKTVYTFDCWVKEGTDIEWDFDTPVTSNITLVARWTENARKYAVDVNGNVTQYEYGSYIQAPKDLDDKITQTQISTFDGWYVKGTLIKWNFATDKVTGEVVLEPRFIDSVRYYTITYTVDGEVYKTDKYEYNAPLIFPQNPQKPSTEEYDYVFIEWEGVSDGTLVTSDMTIEAVFEERQSYVNVSGKVVDNNGKALVAQLYFDGKSVGRSDSSGNYSIKVKPDSKEHNITAVRDGYYEMGVKFVVDSTEDIYLPEIVTMKSGLVGKNVDLAYDRFGLVQDVDKNFALSVNTSGNKAVGYTFLKGLDDGTLAFTLKFNDGCGSTDGKWADALININGIISDNNGKDIGLGISSAGTLNTTGTNLALSSPTNGNGNVGAVLNRLKNGVTDVSYSFVYAKVNSEISLFAKSSLMNEYVFMGSYASNALVGELKLGFEITCDNSSAVLALDVSALTYGSVEDAQKLVDSVRGVNYKVVTYEERADGGYVVSEEIIKGYGNVTVIPEAKEHFVLNIEKSVLEGEASEDLVLSVYYDRERFDVDYVVDGEVYKTLSVRYGQTPKAPFIPSKSGYTARWDKTITNCSGNETVTAIYEESDTFALNVSVESKKITINGKDYDAYDFSAQELQDVKITLKKDGGAESDYNESVRLVPGNYTIKVSHNGNTYSENVVISDSDVNVTVGISKTKLGGSVGGFSSFVNGNKVYVSNDAVSLSHHDYTYNDSVQGDRYYIESDIFFDAIGDKTSNAMVGIMPAVRNEKLEGSGAGKLIVGVTQAGKLAYTYKGGWSYAPVEIADVKDKVTYNGNKYSYKLGVYRNGADFALFINGEYIDTITLGMFGKCGFGVGSVGNNDSNGKTHFTEYKYSFNEELLSALQEQVFGKQITVKVTTDTDYVLDKNGNKMYYQDGAFSNSIAQNLSFEIVDYYGNAVKSVVGAEREFSMTLPQGMYTLKANYQGVKGSTTNSKTISIGKNTKSITYDICITDIGGSFTIPGGNTVNSFNRNYTVNTADSITLNTSTMAYINNVTADKVYIEGRFDKKTTGWYGFVLNVSEGATNENYNRIVFAVLLDSVGAEHSLFVKHSEIGDWWKGSGKGSIESLITDSSASYKMGVLRINDYYYVYINDTLFWSGQISALSSSGSVLPADNKSGFGVFAGSNCGSGARLISDIKYTTDMRVASEILKKEVYTLSCDSEVTLVSGGREVVNGGDIYELESASKLIKIDVPSGKDILDIDVRIDGAKQNIEYVSDGVYSFEAMSGGDIKIDVEFGETANATLALGYKSAVVVKDGVEYAMYDIADVVASDITVSVLNVYTGKVVSFALDTQHQNINLDSGTYRISYEYNDNVCEKIVQIKPGENTFEGEISKAYLGGSISFINKSTGNNYTLTSFDRVNAGSTSGGSWSLIDGQRNSVHMTNFTYVMQDKVVADQIYIEGKFDLTSQKFTGKIDESFGGLLVAHGLDELSGNENSWARNNSHKLMVGIYKESLVVNWDKDFGTTNTVVISNLEQRGLLSGDRSRVKVGVLRNKNNYYFYVNDVYVGKYIWEVQTDASGIGLVDIKSDVKIHEFNYSTNKEIIDALTPEQKLKDIDIYFIAGQSNASGYTKYNQDTVMALNDDYVYGFNNIWYTGNSRSGTSTVATNRVRDISLMRAGYGAYSTTMGVEPGLAEALSVYYNHETGREAGFIKYAAGGTRLLNYFTGENGPEGNWVPPSYQATLTSGVTNKTGGLYRNFLAQVRKSIADYKKLGYNPVVKGLYWMQGESDRGEPTEYMKAFKCFASDVRKDLTDICGQDCSSMPIIIGEISRSFSSCDSNSMNLNAGFIAMQNTIPQNVPNTYIVKSSVFDQNAYINGVATKVGSDQYHWNYKDHLKIGNLVGECILENVLAFDK